MNERIYEVGNRICKSVSYAGLDNLIVNFQLADFFCMYILSATLPALYGYTRQTCLLRLCVFISRVFTVRVQAYHYFTNMFVFLSF